MRRKMARIMCVFLTLSMMFALAAGCTQKETAGTSKQTDVGQKDTGSVEKTSESFKITYAGVATGPVNENSYAEKQIEAAFPNVDLEFWPMEQKTYSEQLTTRIAGGDVPDMMAIFGDLFATYTNQGILGEIKLDLMKEYMPEWWEQMLSYGSEVFLASVKDGVNYGIPIMNIKNARCFVNGWRQDWLEKVGITKIPETLEEMEIALKKFREEDPDGNGKKDTYGLSLRGKDNMHMAIGVVFGAYGIFSNFWNLADDGTVQLGIVMPQAKQALETLNRWYEMEIIDPEFVTTDNNLLREKWYNGQIGYLDMGVYYRWLPGEFLRENLLSINPDARIAMAPPPKGPEGKSGYYNWGKVTNCLGFSNAFTKDEAKMKVGLEMVNKMNTDKELFYSFMYGKEGVHYEIDKELNYPISKEPYNVKENCADVGNNFMFYVGTPLTTEWSEKGDAPEYYKYSLMGNVKDNEHYFTNLGKLIPTEARTKAPDLTVLHQKAMIEFITGERPLSEFDNFVEEWMAAGGKEYTEAANKAYNNYSSIIDGIKQMIK